MAVLLYSPKDRKAEPVLDALVEEYETADAPVTIIEFDMNARGVTAILGRLWSGSGCRAAYPIKGDDHFMPLLNGFFHICGFANIGDLGFVVRIYQHQSKQHNNYR